MRQPVEQITDRAKRYRANQDIPDGPRVCAFCGAKEHLGVDHLDGYEEHGEPENLIWLCKSCNGKKAAVFQKAGLGRPTNQYNPGLFSGLLRKIWGPHQTYHRDVRAERKARAAEARAKSVAEQRESVEEKRRERYEKGKPVSRYKGVQIYRRGDGEYYASLDPDSRYDSLRDAKKVIDHFKNPAGTYSRWSRAVGILKGEVPGSPRQAVRIVRSTPPGRRLKYLRDSIRNPGAKTLGAFMEALAIVQGRSPGTVASARKLIHETPRSRRAEFQREVWAIRKERYGPSGRQGSFFSFFDEVPF